MTDPTRREAFVCPDCSTQQMVTASAPEFAADGSTGAVVAVVHDDSCPWLATVAEAERVQIDDFGAVVHLATSDLPTAGDG